MAHLAKLEAQSARAAPRKALAAISPYEPGMTPALASRRFGPLDYAKLSSNENPFGPSPRAIQAAATALATASSYPDSTSRALIVALSRRLGVTAERIAVGPGSEAVIDYFFRAYLSPGEALMLSRPTFPSYEIFARSAGADIIDVPRDHAFAIDVAAVRGALERRRPRALALCTPNNPTGNRTSRRDIAAILEATHHETVVLMDEAYAEFHDEPSALDLLEAWGGVFLLTRTFSKAYGLAGLRVGYGIASGPEVVAALERLRPAFNITSASQAAAVAALGDREHLRAGVAAIIAERERIQARLAELGVFHTQSEANFVFARSPARLEEAFEALLAEGLIVRPIRAREGYFRITVGEREHNNRVLAALAELA